VEGGREEVEDTGEEKARKRQAEVIWWPK